MYDGHRFSTYDCSATKIKRIHSVSIIYYAGKSSKHNIIMFIPALNNHTTLSDGNQRNDKFSNVMGQAIDVMDNKIRYCHDILRRVGCISSI